MSKRFVIIRHAKSSWDDIGIRDFDRPLNHRGVYDAPRMGARLLDYLLVPDKIYASTALRTTQTAKAIAEAMGYTKEIVFLEKLYHAPANVIETIISTADNEDSTIFIVAHNPGVTEFMIEQTQSFVTDNMPTCAIAAFELQSEDWADFYVANKKLIKYDFPKNKD